VEASRASKNPNAFQILSTPAASFWIDKLIRSLFDHFFGLTHTSSWQWHSQKKQIKDRIEDKMRRNKSLACEKTFRLLKNRVNSLLVPLIPAGQLWQRSKRMF
jgi:hypothetical protein